MPFDEAAARRAELFFEEFLTLTKGRWYGQPFELLDFQREIIRNIFGTLNDDGTRQYRTVYIEMPKKNGKSPIAAGIALYLLVRAAWVLVPVTLGYLSWLAW